MTTKHLTLRVNEDSLRRLEAQSSLSRENRSELAKRLIDEGLRMESHPGIYFKRGSAGRRPALVGGPDVWVLARVFRELEGGFEDVVKATSELTELPPHIVRIAMRYYAEFGPEIDDWIREQDAYAERAEAGWAREQDPAR
jgi:hypothetical protein